MTQLAESVHPNVTNNNGVSIILHAEQMGNAFSFAEELLWDAAGL